MSEVEKIVRDCLCQVLNRPLEQGPELKLDESLTYEFGLGSLDLIMLMSSVCTEAGVPLTELNEDDIGRLRTPSDIVKLLISKQPAS